MRDMDLTNYNEVVELVSKVVKDKLKDKNLLDIKDYTIPVGLSNRHIHLCRESLDVLYGTGYELTKLRDLSQPGEFAAKEKLTIIGPKMKAIEGVRILGPLRDYTQIELSRTDGFILGIDLPVCMSGDLGDSASITVVGPNGSLHLKKGAIRAARHIHMTKEGALHFQVKDRDTVSVEIPGDSGVIFHNVTIRVSDNYKLELHIDTDEGNAADVSKDSFCRMIL